MTDAPQVFDLSEVDADAPEVVLAWVERLRAAAARGRVIVRECPQMLAHTLYKSALLGDAIVLESVRAEEAYG
ncbi:hypothetical protein OV203_17220 [Nannocystis sp. ILAH1]|uniref:hypothetical protein n=1 Tax=unclassified Nannocystis TaxID=2627009 RepID=UPI0022702DC5|nr:MULTISPECIES: hypothetical protein [unclassified Nannocystis]MCY0988881.1 hypothetical protein [Nannocystis sp. ILAH1]MCY1072693.1 hypothetical protein [Nannocystis sp. RBIL2]